MAVRSAALSTIIFRKRLSLGTRKNRGQCTTHREFLDTELTLLTCRLQYIHLWLKFHRKYAERIIPILL